MYTLYAEDTSSPDRAFVKIRDLRSSRFSRAMREARQEPVLYTHCRLFVSDADGHHDIADADRTYLDTPRPASTLAVAALRAAVSAPRGVDWSSNASGETLGEIYVETLRLEAERAAKAQPITKMQKHRS